MSNIKEQIRQEINKWVEEHLKCPSGKEYDELSGEILKWGKLVAKKFYKLGKESLTWQDIREIVQTADNMLDDPEARIAYQNHNEEYYYKKVLELWKGKCHL